MIKLLYLNLFSFNWQQSPSVVVNGNSVPSAVATPTNVLETPVSSTATSATMSSAGPASQADAAVIASTNGETLGNKMLVQQCVDSLIALPCQVLL